MAEILPIGPWRYNQHLASDIAQLVSPLFDVVSDKQRESLYHNPLNSIHLSVPRSSNAREAARLLEAWKQNGILTKDKLPGIYVYYQFFKLAGSARTFCRKGFICHIRTYNWEDNVILRHENTIPGSVNDRISMLDQTELHASATHGLYTDTDFVLEPFMDQAIGNPIYETEDYQGVKDVMAVIHDAAIVRKFVETLQPRQVILADGHHRYEGSLALRQMRSMANPGHRGDEGYNFHLMYLTNTENADLRILPTHRLILGMDAFDPAAILTRLQEDFVVTAVDDADTLNEVIVGKPWTFGLLFQHSAYRVSLKPRAFDRFPWPFPDLIKRLDLTVMHYFIIEKALGIRGRDQRQSPHLAFDRSFGDCLKKTLEGEAQMAIITNELSIEDVKQVCHSGYTLPQKSTYFYPKVVSGFLFSSLKEDEFAFPPFSPF